MENTNIYALLGRMGIGSHYRGYAVCISAVTLCLEEPDRLLAVTKDLYPPVGVMHQSTWKSVERSIRTIASKAWERNPGFLEEVAGYSLGGPPSASEFIDILTNYLIRN